MDNGKVLYCSICGISKQNVDIHVKKYKCSLCLDKNDPFVIQFFNKALEKNVQKQTSIRKPRGWAFMAEYVDSVGNVYHKGKLIPQLFGTIQPTEIIVKPKKSRVSKRQKYNTQIQVFNKINQLKNQIIAAYQDKNSKLAHRLQKSISEYKKQMKKYLK